MNSFAKFQAKLGISKPAAEAKVPVASKPIQKQQEIHDRILTVDIKMMRMHMRDTNFNNANTILEVFAKIDRITQPADDGSNMRECQLTLKSLENTQPCFKMEANYFGNTRHIQYGNDVRVVGRLIGQTGRFRVVRISNIDIDNEEALIERLKAITAFELTKLK